MCAALALIGCGAPSPGEAVPGAGEAAVRVEFADLDRLHAVLKELRGRPVFVNFWATWCTPCVEELPDLGALARDSGAQDVAFLGVSLDAATTGNGPETEGRVRRTAARSRVEYRNLIYTGDTEPLLDGFGLPGSIPYSILYDGRGRVASTWDGPAPIQEVRAAIAAAARASPP